MKRVAIVSRVHGINYGANLQAVALQAILSGLQIESDYIDYEVIYSNHGFRKILSLGYSIIRYFWGYRTRLIRTKHFRAEFLSFSKRLRSIEGVAAISPTYDYIMSGSDQIWNPRYMDASNGLYLLEFSNQTKLSYGSSFGVDRLPSSLMNRYRESLSKYKYLSVREQSGKAIINSLGLECEVVVDPTLLLSSQQWRNYFSPTPLIKKQYICCYVMPGDETCNSAVIHLAKQLNSNDYQIVVLGDKEYKRLYNKRIKYITSAGPAEFLNVLYYSQFIITSSFHGTCFSLIFNKPFYTVLNEKNSVNSRITDLLASFGIKSRGVYTHDIHLVNSINDGLDYLLVNQLLEKKRSNSYEFLMRMFDISRTETDRKGRL